MFDTLFYCIDFLSRVLGRRRMYRMPRWMQGFLRDEAAVLGDTIKETLRNGPGSMPLRVLLTKDGAW